VGISSDQHAHLATSFRSLAKLIKAAGFYPPNHPALEAAREAAYQHLLPLVQADTLELTIKKNALLLGETPVSADDNIVMNLASFLFVRRMKKLFFLQDLDSRDLLTFARIVAHDPGTIHNHHGVGEMLVAAKCATVWANEIDLSRLETVEEEEPEELVEFEDYESELPLEEELSHGAEELWQEDPSAERTFESIMWELQQADSDDKYQQLIDELLPLVWDNLNPDGRSLITQFYFTLVSNVQDPHFSAPRRETSRRALQELGTEHHFHFLMESLCLKDIPSYNRSAVQNILAYYGLAVLMPLLTRLTEEEDSRCRHHILEILRHQPAEALPELLPFLKDRRWYVVRNVILILGEIRHQAALPPLVKMLGHPDTRVRREALRAITRIGGPQAGKILIRVVEKGDAHLGRLALMSMGALQDPDVTEFLLKLAKGESLGELELDEETRIDAINGLGQIGSAKVIPALVELLQTRKLWKRAEHEQIRIAAARALGGIGDPAVAEILEKATQDRSEEVARAAALALRQIRPGSLHESSAI